MITIQFKRFGNGIFVPHVDVLRNLNRTFRRAEIDVGYSKGFVKHMKLKLTQPLPFGVADEDGYVTADVEVEDLKKALNDFNENCPPFLRAVAIYRTEKNPNLAGIVNFCDYVVPASLNGEQIDAINTLPVDYAITIKKGDVEEKKSTEGLIKRICADENGLRATLAFGNVNLRIDKLIEQFNSDFSTRFELTETTRTVQRIVSDKDTTVADFLKNIASECFFAS